jgi:hypothetical protein
MAKQLALYFGAAGYLLVIWYNGFAFAPLSNSSAVGDLLYRACPMCMCSLGERWEGPVLIWAPLNALAYAAVGFLLGFALQKLKRPSGSHGDPNPSQYRQQR